MARENATNIDRDILVIGNSHAGQVGEALICALRGHIVHMSATDLFTGCLIPWDNWANEPCNGQGIVNHCGMYLASATLGSGIHIQMANNHPWLFGGPDRLTAALAHMDIRPDRLGTILIGDWNKPDWAEGQLADPMRSQKGLYPIPQFLGDFVDSNGEWHNYTLCGGGVSFSNVDKKMRKQLTQEWTIDALLDYFADQGFRGNIIAGTALESVSYNSQRWENNTTFKIHHVPTPKKACLCPTCGPGIPDAHHCMPGEPFLFVEFVLKVALAG